MNQQVQHSTPLPSRWQEFLFQLKAAIFRTQRGLSEFGKRPHKYLSANELRNAPLLAEMQSPLWTQTSSNEFPLTAGKVENLRVVAKALHGLEIPPEKTFSFWRQVGRTTKSQGYTMGRELREGCMVPNLGGGLCQLTGLLYQAALEAGLEVVERHEHSRLVPGSMGEKNLDATVFWNYVDLRFRADFRWRIEVTLSASELRVRIKSPHAHQQEQTTALLTTPELTTPEREPATGDCLTCDQVECFRHPSATSSHAPGQGHSTFLLDSRWPEFDEWCHQHSQEGDRWLMPLDGRRWHKPNYAWSPPQQVDQGFATLPVLLRSFQQRRLPAQGAIRQAALLASDERLAEFYAKKLSPECRHLVVSQNLLPHLWKIGALGGRTFDVLIERWPLQELQRRLDQGAQQHPDSPTLADFRADPDLVALETEALSHAGRLITPHQAIAKHFGHQAWLLDWQLPDTEQRDPAQTEEQKLFFPCSPLARKGIYELKESLTESELEVFILGQAREGGAADPLSKMNWKPATLSDLPSARALVLPAWIEQQPRLALRALAMGIPVIATEDCGLPPHPLLQEIKAGASDELKNALSNLPSQT